jgi:hypothetical protein
MKVDQARRDQETGRLDDATRPLGGNLLLDRSDPAGPKADIGDFIARIGRVDYPAAANEDIQFHRFARQQGSLTWQLYRKRNFVYKRKNGAGRKWTQAR